jgi:lysophospholipase L1-like esterase
MPVLPALPVSLLVSLLLLASACTTATSAGPAASPGLSVVGLGDSVMLGTRCGCDGIMSRYAEREQAASGARIVPVNLGASGATTATLLSDLRSSSVLGRVTRARVVVVIVGANDLGPQLRRRQRSECTAACYEPAVRAMAERLHDVLQRVSTARRSSTGPVLVLDYWNVFPDGEQTAGSKGRALVDWARGVSRVANAAICRTSAVFHDTCVDLYGPMVGADRDPTALLAPDGDHPNARGVDLIVDRLVAATPAGVFAG